MQLSAPGRICAQEGVELVTADTVTLSATFAGGASWAREKTALLYRDASGQIALEVPLVRSEDLGANKLVVREVTGGVSANGRFAYSFDKTVVWNGSKTKVLKRQTFLRVYGTDGKPLWDTAEADAPEGQEPLLFSSDGETALVLLKKEKGWTASVRYYLGATIMEAGPLNRVEEARLTRNGAYAMIRWLVPDQSSTHTFLDIAKKARKDIPSGELHLGQARLSEDGKVASGKKVVFDFNAPPKEAK